MIEQHPVLFFAALFYLCAGICAFFHWLLDDLTPSIVGQRKIGDIGKSIVFFVGFFLFLCLCWPLYALGYESA